MPPSWRCALALAALQCGLGDDIASGPEPVATTGDGVPREALLRAEGASDDWASAVVSSHGVKFVTPHHGAKARESHTQPSVSEGEVASLGASVLLEAAADDGAIPLESRSPNGIYFGVGIATFLAALGLMAMGMRKFNYLEAVEPEGEVQSGNPQGEDEPPAPVGEMSQRRNSVNPEHPGNFVQFRMQQVLVAWTFIVASVAYFMDYLAMQASLAKACHYFGMAAALLWLIGFLIHFHWQLSVGCTGMQIVSLFLKVMACIMMQVHPFSMIIGKDEADPIVWWTAFMSLALWHSGNLVSLFDLFYKPPDTSDRNAGIMAWGNLEVTEISVDALATGLLLFASIAVTQWNGHIENQLLPRDNYAVVICEFGGALLFLAASCVKCEWCNGFRDCRHRGAPAREIEGQAPASSGLLGATSSSSSSAR